MIIRYLWFIFKVENPYSESFRERAELQLFVSQLLNDKTQLMYMFLIFIHSVQKKIKKAPKIYERLCISVIFNYIIVKNNIIF